MKVEGKRQTQIRAMPPCIEFYTAINGRRLAARVWRADGSPLARLVFLHGITSHAGWYEQAGRYLADARFDVHFLDRRGSGLNAYEPGDVDDWRTWIEDVAAYLRSIDVTRTRTTAGANELFCGRKPNVLCGISWGGKLAVAAARRHAALVDAVALICPGIYSPFLPGLAKRALLSARAPRWLEQRRVRIPLRYAELFTDTRRWREFIEKDPLALRRVTWRFAQEDRRLTRFARASAPHLHLPTLLMLAGQDRIVDNGCSREFFARVAGRHKTLIEYPRAAHTLEFEPDPAPYFSDLSDWIGRTVGIAVHN
jgi:acylglycerol lipase